MAAISHDVLFPTKISNRVQHADQVATGEGTSTVTVNQIDIDKPMIAG